MLNMIDQFDSWYQKQINTMCWSILQWLHCLRHTGSDLKSRPSFQVYGFPVMNVPPHLYDDNPYAGKTASQYSNGPHVLFQLGYCEKNIMGWYSRDPSQTRLHPNRCHRLPFAMNSNLLCLQWVWFIIRWHLVIDAAFFKNTDCFRKKYVFGSKRYKRQVISCCRVCIFVNMGLMERYDFILIINISQQSRCDCYNAYNACDTTTIADAFHCITT